MTLGTNKMIAVIILVADSKAGCTWDVELYGSPDGTDQGNLLTTKFSVGGSSPYHTVEVPVAHRWIKVITVKATSIGSTGVRLRLAGFNMLYYPMSVFTEDVKINSCT
jgi:hypothetical protein